MQNMLIIRNTTTHGLQYHTCRRAIWKQISTSPFDIYTPCLCHPNYALTTPVYTTFCGDLQASEVFARWKEVKRVKWILEYENTIKIIDFVTHKFVSECRTINFQDLPYRETNTANLYLPKAIIIICESLCFCNRSRLLQKDLPKSTEKVMSKQHVKISKNVQLLHWQQYIL